MKTTRKDVYQIIEGEVDYQGSRLLGNSVGDYLTIIRDLSVKADAAWDCPGHRLSLDFIRSIAGVCVRAMEVHGAPKRSM